MKQQTLPGTGIESLPLFSGTAPRVDAPLPARPQATARQTTLAKCRVCLDTGRVKQGKKRLYCWCEAGQRARQDPSS